jgi:hypothetical protein
VICQKKWKRNVTDDQKEAARRSLAHNHALAQATRAKYSRGMHPRVIALREKAAGKSGYTQSDKK